MKTDHSEYIKVLRDHNSISSSVAADLLELHDATGISLDNWDNARQFIRSELAYIEADGGYALQENGA